VTLRIKYVDFHQITRSQSPREGIAGRAALEGIALELLTAQFPAVKGIRLLGKSISVLGQAGEADTE
jgi:DNA polymerase IV